ncbi:MAG: hypothetical protein MHPDNHAH_01512 [Anaerolineales bacterium]|nr:hypothetical protein [Anaerolineales bacterium]
MSKRKTKKEQTENTPQGLRSIRDTHRPIGLSAVMAQIKEFKSIVDTVTAPHSKILEEYKRIEKMTKGARSIAESASRSMAWLEKYSVPNTYVSGLYKTANDLYSDVEEIEEVIEVIPETVQKESPKLQPSDKAEFQTLFQDMKSELATAKNEMLTLRNRLEKLEQSKRTNKKKIRGANLATIDKIIRLAEYRQEAIDQRGVIPAWISSCQQLGVDSRSVMNYARELREKWEDKTFRFKGFDKQ